VITSTEDEAPFAAGAGGDEAFKASASCGADRGAASETGVDDVDLLEAQRPGPSGSVIRPALAFGVMLPLALRRLAPIPDRFALPVQGGDCGRRGQGVQRSADLRRDRL
jgi:hypothetical protein